jgi:hypothetical protein
VGVVVGVQRNTCKSVGLYIATLLLWFNSKGCVNIIRQLEIVSVVTVVEAVHVDRMN